MIGCSLAAWWAVAWRPGELSQQPMWPHVWHMRRCTQVVPAARHSSHPASGSGRSRRSIESRWVQAAMAPCSHPAPAAAVPGVRAGDPRVRARSSSGSRAQRAGRPARVDVIRRMALRTTQLVGTPAAFSAAILLALVWVLGGFMVGWTDKWLLWPSAIASIVTFLIAFSLQYTQNRDTRAVQLKLDEILRATEHARNQLVKLERLSDEELGQIEEEIVKLRDADVDDAA